MLGAHAEGEGHEDIFSSRQSKPGIVREVKKSIYGMNLALIFEHQRRYHEK
ncbi:hypothetical protein ACEQPO_09470 [Bacillus sp. SL00103]